MTRPPGAMCSSVGRLSAIQTRSVTSKTASSRFDAVSSGPKSRKVWGLARMTSRSHVPRTRVASLVAVAGDGTATP